ncbi:MAG: hypothetical protein JWM93_1095, partial [Frankiales bacterium]|nr:hypothetical protein [Frankiales bacterium]
MTEPTDLVEVRILELPVPLRERATEHSEELLREMTLISQQLSDDRAGALPSRLLQLVAEVRSNFAIFTTSANHVLEQAAEQGVPVIGEIVYNVPVSTGDYCRHLIDIVEETDQYCRDGEHLLTLATPPEVLAYLRWILGEFVRQTQGEPALS